MRQRGWLASQLPLAMLDDPVAPDAFLRRFVQIFEDVFDTVLDTVDGFEHYLDPAVCPEVIAPWLGAWLGIEAEGLDLATQRRLITVWGSHLDSRGTVAHLTTLVTALTGAMPQVEDGGGPVPPARVPRQPRRKRVVLHVPALGTVTAAQLLAAVQADVPADVDVVVRVGQVAKGSNDQGGT